MKSSQSSMLPAVPDSSTARSHQVLPSLETQNTCDTNITPFFSSSARKDNVRQGSSCSVLAVGGPATNTLPPHYGIGNNNFTPKLCDFQKHGTSGIHPLSRSKQSSRLQERNLQVYYGIAASDKNHGSIVGNSGQAVSTVSQVLTTPSKQVLKPGARTIEAIGDSNCFNKTSADALKSSYATTLKGSCKMRNE